MNLLKTKREKIFAATRSENKTFWAPAQEFLSVCDSVFPPVLQLGAGEVRGFEVVQDRVVFPLFPQIIAVGLQAADKDVHGDLHHVFTTRALQKTNGNQQL